MSYNGTVYIGDIVNGELRYLAYNAQGNGTVYIGDIVNGELRYLAYNAQGQSHTTTYTPYRASAIVF